MKKILFVCIVFVSLFILKPADVSALPSYNISGKLVIDWIDYGNKFNTRPESVTYVFLDEYTDDTVTKTFYAKDAVIKSTPTTTTWTFDVDFLGEFEFSKFIVWDNDEVGGYRKDYSSGGAIGDGQTQINMHYITDFEKNITYTEHWDDGGGRDNDRAFGLEMIPINNDRIEIQRLTCGRDEEKYIDENTCQEVIKILYLYPIGDDGVPIWEEETQFEYKIVERFNDYEYRYEVDENGNIDVYIKHEPRRLDDSSILINWLDNNDRNKKRPTELTLDLYNHNTKEQTIKVTNDDDWNKVLTDLYENYDTNIVPSEYSLKATNTDDYEFEITGDTTNGFVINAKYIGEDLVINEPEENNQDNSNINKVNNDLNNEKTSNPKTSDNIVIYIVLLCLSILGVAGSTYYLKKRKNN